jgi:hypothetical protein
MYLFTTRQKSLRLSHEAIDYTDSPPNPDKSDRLKLTRH